MATIVLAFAIALASLVVVQAGWGANGAASPTAVPPPAGTAGSSNATSPTSGEGGLVATSTLGPSPPTNAPATAADPSPMPTQVAVASPTPAPPPTPTALPTRETTHTVLIGESYIGIANKLGIDLNDLLRANRRTVNTPLYPGDVLQLP